MFVEVNLFDVGLVTLLIIFIVKGRSNGLFLELLHIGGFFIALVASLNLLRLSSKWVYQIIELAPHISVVTGFALTFSIILLLYQFLVAFILKNSKVQIEEWLNRLGATLLGALKGLNVCSLLCLMFLLFPISKTVVNARDTSFAFRYTKNIMPAVYSVVKRVVPGSPQFDKIVDDTFLGFDLSALDDYSKKFLQEYGSERAKEISASTYQ
jgi:uncharacterized membrane protein required for colicin V production